MGQWLFPMGVDLRIRRLPLFLETAKNTCLHGKRHKRVIRSEGALRLREGRGRGQVGRAPTQTEQDVLC